MGTSSDQQALRRRWHEHKRDGKPQYRLSLPSTDPDEPGLILSVRTFEEWGEQYRSVVPERAAQMRLLVERGEAVRLVDSHVLSERDQIALRRRLWRAMEGRDERRRWSQWKGAEEAQIRYLIDGLVTWGICPTLAGQSGAGKTRLLAIYLRALVDPTFRFLGRFGPSTLAQGELERLIVVLNTETPPVEFEAELMRAGLSRDDGYGLWGVLRPDLELPDVGFAIRVIHLEYEGGATLFDITEEAKFEAWVERLLFCDECDGEPGDEFAPIMLIVDGMTAVLEGDPNRYARFIDAYHRLLDVVDIPNGLILGHSFGTTSRLLGPQENMTRQDGRWSYMSDDPDNPFAARRFKVSPRGMSPAVPSTLVVVGDDGLLYLDGWQPRSQPVPEPEDGQESEPPTDRTGPPEPPPLFGVEDVAHNRLALKEAGAAGALRTEVTGRGRYGVNRKAALDWMVDQGEAVRREEPNPRGGSPWQRYWLAECASPG